jgi:hypothetical protein
MAIVTPNTVPRILDGGLTGRETASAFARVQITGVNEFAARLQKAADAMGKDQSAFFLRAVRNASLPIKVGYINKVRDVTGNLRKSVQTRTRNYGNGVYVAVTGPAQSGNRGSDPEEGSGNHAFLVEFGTGRRKPGTQGRRTYVNVHQQINGRMKRTQTMNDEQFARSGSGYYFIMGSKNEPTRQARAGSGYPHDFGPITLGPGDTIAPMPAQHAMENTIRESANVVQTLLNNAISRRMANL